MRLAVRLVRGTWPAWVEGPLHRFTWADPRAILNADVQPQAFREAMNAVHVGGTFKITGISRHTAADDLLLDHVNLSRARLVDIGASDGSTSVDLVNRLPEDFAAFIVADLYLTLRVRRVGPYTLFYDMTDTCVLVVGIGLLGWPEMSLFARLFFAPVTGSARRTRILTDAILVNPTARQLMVDDPRVSMRVHDVFHVWEGKKPDVIKVANLLRRLYFADEDIKRALGALHASLKPEGHLLVLDNPRISGISLRAGLYQRTTDGFAVVATTATQPEIADLVLGVNASKSCDLCPITAGSQ